MTNHPMREAPSHMPQGVIHNITEVDEVLEGMGAVQAIQRGGTFTVMSTSGAFAHATLVVPLGAGFARVSQTAYIRV